MRKFLLTLAGACLSLSMLGAERILYQQNFETVGTPEEAGWTYGGASMTLASDQFGKFLELSLGQNNGRSGQVTWGQEIFMNDGQSVLEDGTYNMSFEFSINTMPTNQFNSCLLYTSPSPRD